MRHLPIAALAAAALLSGCGRPLLSAQVEVPEIRITHPGVSFDPIAAPSTICTGLGSDCVFSDLTFDLDAEVPVFEEEGVTFDLRLLDVGLRFTSAGGLSAIQGVRIYLTGPDGAQDLVASYARPAGGPIPTELLVSGRADLDLAPYLAAGVLGLRIELDYDASGGLSAFEADVQAGFSLAVTVDYQSLL